MQIRQMATRTDILGSAQGEKIHKEKDSIKDRLAKKKERGRPLLSS